MMMPSDYMVPELTLNIHIPPREDWFQEKMLSGDKDGDTSVDTQRGILLWYRYSGIETKYRYPRFWYLYSGIEY